MKKNFWKSGWLVIWIVTLLFLAFAEWPRLSAQSVMPDSGAMAQMTQKWGPLAMIGQARNVNDTYWTTQLGLKTPGCKTPFTVMATGTNTWESAFTALIATPPTVKGPYKGSLSIQIQAWDVVKVAGMTLWVDGLMFPPFAPSTTTPPPNPQTFTAILSLDTTTYADGYHVLCAQATNPTPLVAYSDVFIFQTNQATGTVAGILKNPPAATPSMVPAIVVSSH